MTSAELHSLVDTILIQHDIENDAPATRPRPTAASRRYSTSPTAWTRAADRLAEAVMAMLNRSDACGGYRGGIPTTRKETDRDWLPMRDALRCHFAGHRVIGLHAASPANVCRWVAFDLDSHNGEDAAANLDAAQELASCFRRSHIFDSDGRGGLHVWAAVREHEGSPMTTDRTYRWIQSIANKLPVGVETFPKSPHVREGGYGNWIRLPGRHPKRNHQSRVWTADGWGSDEQTIDSIVELAQWVAADS